MMVSKFPPVRQQYGGTDTFPPLLLEFLVEHFQALSKRDLIVESFDMVGPVTMTTLENELFPDIVECGFNVENIGAVAI